VLSLEQEAVLVDVKHFHVEPMQEEEAYNVQLQRDQLTNHYQIELTQREVEERCREEEDKEAVLVVDLEITTPIVVVDNKEEEAVHVVLEEEEDVVVNLKINRKRNQLKKIWTMTSMLTSIETAREHKKN